MEVKEGGAGVDVVAPVASTASSECEEVVARAGTVENVRVEGVCEDEF